jgi:Type II CAAX prenyl endopeptidase Rce1-like
MSAEFSKFDPFDFWFCIVLETAGVVGLVVALPLRPPDRLLVRFCVGAAFYSLLTAGIVGWLSPRSDILVFPLFGDWWRGRFLVKKAAARLAGAAGVGITNCYLARYYAAAVKNWSSGTLPKHHSRPDVLAIVSSTILEEILFRAIIFVDLVVLFRWASKFFPNRSQVGIFWSGNLLQALIFGAAHVAIGVGIPYGSPWYIRLFLSPQTWSGLLLGWIYSKYGLESAIVCHATYDLSFRVLRLL